MSTASRAGVVGAAFFLAEEPDLGGGLGAGAARTARSMARSTSDTRSRSAFSVKVAGAAGADEVAGEVGGGMGDGQVLAGVGGHRGVLRLARASQTCSKTGYRLPGSLAARMSRVGESTPRACGR